MTQGNSPSTPHALYRFFGRDGGLLYIGLTCDPGSRWRQHRQSQPWWLEVATVTVETHPDRASVERAERAAIIAEHPKHNVVHNRLRAPAPPLATGRLNEWTFRNKGSAHEWTVELFLSSEINLSPCVDDVYDEPGEVQLRHWLDQLRRHHPDQWAAGEVHVSWFIVGDCISEGAPVWDRDGSDWDRYYRDCNFLRYFTWPRNAATGERVDWQLLPQRHRFPAFAEAAGPLMPFQSTYSIARALDVAGR